MTTRSSRGTEASEPEFSPERLTLAREKRRLTKQQLAELCDVSRRTVTAWERGDISNPPVSLLADKLGFPEDYFFAGDPVVVDQEAVSFRALSTSTARQVHAAMAAASIAIEFTEWIEQQYRLPPAATFPSAEVEDNVNPVIAAELVRKSWALTAGPVSNMFSTLEKRGGSESSLSQVEIERSMPSHSGETTVRTYSSIPIERRSASGLISHMSLATLCYTRGKQLARSRTVEQEANDFASAFLIPADLLYPQIVGELRYADIFTLKSYWRVSAMAMVERLRRLQLITEWIHRRWIIDLSQEGYRSNEPVGIEFEQSRLLTELLARAREDGWTLAAISRRLRVSQSDLNSLLFGLGGRVVIEGSGERAPPRRSGHLRRVQ